MKDNKQVLGKILKDFQAGVQSSTDRHSLVEKALFNLKKDLLKLDIDFDLFFSKDKEIFKGYIKKYNEICKEYPPFDTFELFHSDFELMCKTVGLDYTVTTIQEFMSRVMYLSRELKHIREEKVNSSFGVIPIDFPLFYSSVNDISDVIQKGDIPTNTKQDDNRPTSPTYKTL